MAEKNEKATGVGAGEAFLNRAVNAIPLAHPVTDVLSAGAVQAAKAFGFGEPGARLTPEALLELEAMGEDLRRSNRNNVPSALETYRRLRDLRNARTAAGSEEHPWAGRAGTAAGIGLTMLAPLPKLTPKGQGIPLAPPPVAPISNPGMWQVAREFYLGNPAGLGSQVLSGAVTGAGYGALSGLTEGSADLTRGEVAEGVGDAVFGGLLGLGLGAMTPALAPAMAPSARQAHALAGGFMRTSNGEREPSDAPMPPAVAGLGRAWEGLGGSPALAEALAKVLRRNPVETPTHTPLPEEARRELLQQQAQAAALRLASEGRQ